MQKSWPRGQNEEVRWPLQEVPEHVTHVWDECGLVVVGVEEGSDDEGVVAIFVEVGT